MAGAQIQKSIDYMEENLFQELRPEMCAEVAGYSVYHYCRLFHSITGVTPMDYIRRRRMSEAVKHMRHTGQTLKDIAFYCGFNSQENFVRVFKAMFGILPTEYRQSRYTLMLFSKINLPKSDGAVDFFGDMEEPRIVTLPGFRVAGIRHETTFLNNRHFEDVPVFWNQFYAKEWYRDFERFTSGDRVDYGVTIFHEQEADLYHEDYTRNDLRISYLTGCHVPDGCTVPPLAESLELPGGTYAVFHNPPSTEYTLIQNLKRTWLYIDFEWLPNSPYVHAGSHEFNEYCPAKDKLLKKIYIPVLLKPTKERL